MDVVHWTTLSRVSSRDTVPGTVFGENCLLGLPMKCFPMNFICSCKEISGSQILVRLSPLDAVQPSRKHLNLPKSKWKQKNWSFSDQARGLVDTNFDWRSWLPNEATSAHSWTRARVQTGQGWSVFKLILIELDVKKRIQIELPPASGELLSGWSQTL